MSKSLVDLFKTNDFILFQDALHRKKQKVASIIFHKLDHQKIQWTTEILSTMVNLQMFPEILFLKDHLSVESLENLVILEKMESLFATWKKKLLDHILVTDNPVLFYKLFNYDPNELTIMLKDKEFFESSLKTSVGRFLYNLGYEHDFFNQRNLDRTMMDFLVRLDDRVLDYIYRHHQKIFYLKDVHENNLLHYAIFDNLEHLIVYLLKKKIDILNEKNMWSLTPLNEAMRLQLYNITHLLREHGASLQNKRDSTQSIIGKRMDFFQKLEIVMNFVPQVLSECIVQLFHSQTSNSHLYCCSLNYCHKSFIDFHETISKITFEKDYLQKLKKVENCHLLPQQDFFLSPVCKDHQIKYMYTFPFCIGPTFLGIFVVWINRKIDRSHFESYFSFIRHFMMDDYKSSFRVFPTFYSYFSGTTYYKNLFERFKIQLSSPTSTYFIPAVRFFSNILDYIGDPEINNCLWVLKKCHHPITQLSTEIYGMLSDLDLPRGHYPSHLFRLMTESMSLSPPPNVPDLETYMDRHSPLLLSVFDVYEIIGSHHDPIRNIAPLNDLIRQKLDPKDLYYALVHLLVGSEFRNQAVIGTGHGSSYRIFLPTDEIRLAMDSLFEIQDASLSVRLFKYYHCLLEWIHPLTDGNGRTARLLVTIYLRSHGIPIVVHSGNKILNMCEFQNMIQKSLDTKKTH